VRVIYCILIFICLLLSACAAKNSPARSEAPPCDNCRSGEEPSFDVKINKAYKEKKYEILALDSGELIGVLPALNVVARRRKNAITATLLAKMRLSLILPQKRILF